MIHKITQIKPQTDNTITIENKINPKSLCLQWEQVKTHYISPKKSCVRVRKHYNNIESKGCKSKQDKHIHLLMCRSETELCQHSSEWDIYAWNVLKWEGMMSTLRPEVQWPTQCEHFSYFIPTTGYEGERGETRSVIEGVLNDCQGDFNFEGERGN